MQVMLSFPIEQLFYLFGLEWRHSYQNNRMSRRKVYDIYFSDGTVCTRKVYNIHNQKSIQAGGPSGLLDFHLRIHNMYHRKLIFRLCIYRQESDESSVSTKEKSCTVYTYVYVYTYVIRIYIHVLTQKSASIKAQKERFIVQQTKNIARIANAVQCHS